MIAVAIEGVPDGLCVKACGSWWIKLHTRPDCGISELVSHSDPGGDLYILEFGAQVYVSNQALALASEVAASHA